MSRLLDLHRFILETLPHPHVLRPDDAGYLLRNLRNNGTTFGTFDEDDQLIGYAALAFPRTAIGRQLCHDLPGLDLWPDHVAVYDGSAVHPAYRGEGLHCLMNRYRREYALQLGVRHLLGTVSPRNPYSLRNHLTRGFVVRALRLKYGGLERFIIHADLRASAVLDGLNEYRCGLLDSAGNECALASGLVGYQVENRDSGWNIAYARLAGGAGCVL